MHSGLLLVLKLVVFFIGISAWSLFWAIIAYKMMSQSKKKKFDEHSADAEPYPD